MNDILETKVGQQTVKDAIKGSIRKWERVCMDVPNKAHLALGRCDLCMIYLGRDCYICPLAMSGNGCLEPRSTYRKIRKASINVPGYTSVIRVWRPKDDLNYIIDLCFEMYESVCDLMPDYDPMLETK